MWQQYSVLLLLWLHLYHAESWVWHGAADGISRPKGECGSIPRPTPFYFGATVNYEQFLMAVRSYIEESQQAIDSEWECRSAEQILADGEMPPLYAEVLKRIQNPSPLVEWLEGDFKHACVHDRKRLREAILMLSVGSKSDDPPEQVMARAIACFVKGLIENTPPGEYLS